MEELGVLHIYYINLHDSIEDRSCKGSCKSSEYGYFKGDLTEESYYYFRFGGYCLADCDRWHELRANSVIDLIHKTMDLFKRVKNYNWETGE